MCFAFTFSAGERVEACPGSAALVQIGNHTAPARKGSVIHGYVRRALEADPATALAEAPEDLRPMLRHYPLDGLPSDPSAYAAEIAFAIHLPTGTARELGRGIERAYVEHGAGPDDVPGAADYVALIGDDTVEVSDLKTGWTAPTPPAENLQLIGLAVAAARTYGRRFARVRLLVRREDGTGYVAAARLDDFDLDVGLERLRRAAAGVAAARAQVARGELPPLAEGPWCAHCPAWRACPAKMSTIRALALQPQRTLEEMVRERLTLEPEVAREAFTRWRQFAAVFKAIERSIKELAAEHPIDLGDGQVYGPHEVERLIVDGSIAHRMLAERFGPEVAAAACDMTTTKSAIKNALRPVAPTRQLTRLYEDTIAALQDAGAVRYDRKVRVEVHAADGPPEIEE